MSFSNLHLTDSGKGIIVKALSGGSINFTKIQIGNGDAPDDADAISTLQNPIEDIAITEITTGDGIAVLNGWFDNASLTSGFYWSEIGVYATDEDLGEVLYAYSHAGSYAEYIPAYSGVSYLKTTLNLAVVVGDATSVSATIGEYSGYASREAFESHVDDLDNPHKVTKDQIGLGNVENYAFADAPVEYDSVDSLTATKSGDTIGTVFAKVKYLITTVINHLSASNPHKISCSTISAAAASHTHSASDITSGTLGIARGGTGATTAAGAANSILANGATSIGGDLNFASYGTSGARGITGVMAINDKWRICGKSTTSDGGILELATSDNGTEPIIARQCNDSGASTSAFETTTRTAYILNGSGNTIFPGTCSATSHVSTSDLKKKDVSGNLDKKTAKKIIMGLSPLSYKFKGEERNRMGFGAQHVFELLQSLAVEESAVYEATNDEQELVRAAMTDEEIRVTDDKKINWTLDYQQLIAPLVSVVQQQQAEIDGLKKRMEEITNGIS